MKQIIDEILNLFDCGNGQKVDELRKIFDRYEVTLRETTERDIDEPTNENDYGALQRPSFRDYEKD